MPPKKGKKKAQAGSSRGFATTSVPSKVKEVIVEPVAEPVPEIVQAIPSAEVDTEAEKLVEEATTIVEAGTKQFSRFNAEIEIDKRARKQYTQLSMPENVIEHVIASHKVTSTRVKRPKLVDLTALYAAELLLSGMGLAKDVINQVLRDVNNPSLPDEHLYHLVKHTNVNLYYGAARRKAREDERPRSPSPAPFISKPRPARMLEILSDEDDQEAIEDNPNAMYVENQLELLALRGRSKNETGLGPQINRLQKRSKVIEQQLLFRRKDASKEVQKAIKDGQLAKLISAHTSNNPSAPASESNSGDEWMAVQGQKPKETDVKPLVPVEPVEIDVSDSDSDVDLPAMFETIVLESSPCTSAEAIVQTDENTLPSFPLILPKTSQNISPLSLLRSYMKKIDKQSRDEFKDHSLILKFSSTKISSRRILIDEERYTFPDQETERHYLCLKAMYTVPELAAEKAGLRFSGVFRSAWQLLEDHGAELQKQQIARQVENVRKIYDKRVKVSGSVEEAPLSTSNIVAHKSSYRDMIDFNLDEVWTQMCTSESYYNMLNYRQTLPIAQYRDVILDSILNNQVTILCGETGCGKSTQLPTFILEHCLSQSRPCRIYVTEPRRISAISLATRVSAELGEHRKAIANGESLLGFSIRLDSQVSDKSRLVYATTGIVLRMLEENNDLGGITHLVIDEVHERSIESDFLLIVVKRLLAKRRDLKVVLMSATLEADRFNDYFGGHCSILNVPGRTFPVEQRFLEDAIELSEYQCDSNSFYARRGRSADLNTSWEIPEEDEEESCEEDLVTYSERTKSVLSILDPYKVNFDLIVLLLEHLAFDNDITVTQAVLIFLPGIGEIRRLLDLLNGHKVFGDHRDWIIYALHSSVSSEKQQAAFDVPPYGIRKIVLATNIAETGITIPDITCVIDAGKHKESRFDARRQLNKLVECFISRSNAKQRMGRAGRVQPGLCYHLFSKARFDKMEEHQLPEFQRLNLDELALRVKVVGMGEIESTLLEALDAPTPDNIKRSIQNLIQVGALDDEQNLTVLGRHLAKLPVDATLGKLVLFGLRYNCLDPCLVIAAILSSKPPFESPIGKEREAAAAKQTFQRGESDFITMWTAYSKWRQVASDRPQFEHKYCKDNYLSLKNLTAIEELRLQYLKILVESKLLPASDLERRTIQRSRFNSSRDGFIRLPPALDRNASSFTFIELCLAGAFYPNLLDEQLKTITKQQQVTIHSGSVNHAVRYAKRWMVYYSLLKTKSGTSAHDTGFVDDYILSLICGHAEFKPFSGLILLDRIRFSVHDLRTLAGIKFLKDNLDAQFQAFLEGRGVDEEWESVVRDLIVAFEGAKK